MTITFDPAKRDRTLAERNLDFADAEDVFAGPLVENPDDRFDYGEDRFVTVGYLGKRMVVVVWTPRDSGRHIISMRKANQRERKRYGEQLGRS
ncbi:MAG TPA: BrnT family toxin [Sphingomicrobium sp.]|nr:BrnT family toxin [Sphingomicrobium sp.]